MDALFQQEELVEALAEAFPEGLRLARGTRGKTLKLQRNAGALVLEAFPGDLTHGCGLSVCYCAF